MAHRIQALIYKPSALGGRVRVLSETARVGLEQGFELLLQREELLEKLETTYSSKPTHLGGENPNLLELESSFAALACELSEFSKIGYVETEYFGGIGSQSAVLWDKGRVIYGPRMEATNSNSASPSREALAASPINSVLRQLGAKKNGQIDEFEGVGLNRVRHLED